MDGEDDGVLRVVVLFPELLGTYGDAGNGLVLAQRARRRGTECELVSVGLHDPLPDADIYLLGGGEDGPQRLACDLLARSSFAERIGDGVHVVAVCAGLQLLGHSFCVEGDDEYAGLGVVDVVTRRGTTRSVGEMAVDVDGRLLVASRITAGERPSARESRRWARWSMAGATTARSTGFAPDRSGRRTRTDRCWP